MTDWISAIATTLAAIFVCWQLFDSRKIAQATFEDSLDQQYRQLSMQIPVTILMGEKCADDEFYAVRELLYNYFDLSNEQAFLYSQGRISSRTWESWRAGILSNMRKPAFECIYSKIRRKQPDAFTHLNRVLSS